MDEKGKQLLNSPILITGCARSGTSIIAGTINFCGAFGGKTTGPTPHNKKGQFENGEIREKVMKSYLRQIGADPLGQNPLPPISNLPMDPVLRRRMLSIIRSQGYHPERDGQWYYKGAKMCLIWPVFAAAFPTARWVIVRRRKEEIVSSCMRTRFMRKRKSPQSWAKWVDHHVRRFDEMKEHLNCTEVWPEKMFQGQFGEIKHTVAWLGLEWKRDVIRDFLEPRLWNKGKGYEGLEEGGESGVKKVKEG